MTLVVSKYCNNLAYIAFKYFHYIAAKTKILFNGMSFFAGLCADNCLADYMNVSVSNRITRNAGINIVTFFILSIRLGILVTEYKKEFKTTQQAMINSILLV